MHRDKLLIIKPTRCTNFSSLFLEWNSICFEQFLCPLSGIFHYTHRNGICHTGLLTATEQDQDGTVVPSWSSPQAVRRPVWHITLLCVQWKTPDDGQRICPKHVEFHSKNEFEKLVHLVGFIIRHRITTWKARHFSNVQEIPASFLYNCKTGPFPVNVHDKDVSGYYKFVVSINSQTLVTTTEL